MIDKRELRIGSFLQDPNWDVLEGIEERTELEYGEVLGIDFNGEDRVEFSWDIPYKGNATAWVELRGLEPIRLTNNWVENLQFTLDDDFTLRLDTPNADFGFIFHAPGDVWNFILIKTANGYDFYTKKGGAYITHVHYVHELQSLYFALTGEELIIKYK